MENLLIRVPLASTRTQKQMLSAEIIASMPGFLREYGEIEQRYMVGLKKCADAEGSKTRAELLIGETDLYKEYKYKKRLYDTITSTIGVLNMYTGDK